MSVRDRALRIAAIGGAAIVGLNAYAHHSVRQFEDLEPETAGAPGAFVDVDGVRVHYVEAGHGDPIVLIHGLNAATFSFRYMIPDLAQHFRVVALDLKGFGFSDRQAGGDYSLTAQAKLVERTMARLGIERASVVGHSMGGAVAIHLATLFPQRVDRLVLVDSATDRELQRGLRVAPLIPPLLPIIALLGFHRRTIRRIELQSGVHDPAYLTPEILDEIIRWSKMKGHLRGLGSFLVDRRRDGPLRPEAISAPTLILWGEHDRWLPLESGEELARRIPNARLDVVPSCGHMPMEEQPDYSSRALLAFLRPSEPAEASQREPAAQPEITS